MPNPREKYLSLKMKLFVERFTSDKDATISAIYLDDVFQCFGLEDEYREEKVASETRFPAGSYKGMTSHIPVVFMLDMKKSFQIHIRGCCIYRKCLDLNLF